MFFSRHVFGHYEGVDRALFTAFRVLFGLYQGSTRLSGGGLTYKELVGFTSDKKFRKVDEQGGRLISASFWRLIWARLERTIFL